MPGNKNSGRKKKYGLTLHAALPKRPRGRPPKSPESNSPILTPRCSPGKEPDDVNDDVNDSSEYVRKLHPMQVRTSEMSREWDQAVGPAIDMLPRSRLPTKRAILKCYRAMRINDPYSKTTFIAENISGEILSIWGMAPKIPILSSVTVRTKLAGLLKKHMNLAPASRRLLPDYQASLDSLFNICTLDVDELQRKMCPAHQRDFDFFVGMTQVPQIGSITTTTDTVTLKRSQAADARCKKYQEFQQKHATSR